MNELLHDIKQFTQNPEYKTSNDYLIKEVSALIEKDTSISWQKIKEAGYSIDHLGYTALLDLRDILNGYKKMPLHKLARMCKAI
jgi:hypothetical protein